MCSSCWYLYVGRRLLLVGISMEPIYRSGEAEVGFCLRTWHQVIGSVRPEPLTLSANFRSHAGIVEWVNATFSRIMPRTEDIHGGAVTYSPSQAVHPAEGVSVQVHALFDSDAAGEARRVAQIARDALAESGRDPA